MVLEQLSTISSGKGVAEDESILLMRNRAMKAVFSSSLIGMAPIYIASLIDSMVKLENQ